jgi:glyoxylase-like metal-dependent hydrolase (beta-lactamase superfamily II)
VTVGRVHHLNCGSMRPPIAVAIGQRGWGRGLMVCHCLVIETARDGIVLVDSGFSSKESEDPRRLPGAFRRVTAAPLDLAETAAHQLVELGLDPRDVRHIVLTHLDLDHAAGIADFPRAAVHVHEREHAAATARTTRIERERYRPVQWEHGPDWRLHAERGDTWRGLPSIARLPGLDADIGLVPLHGHSRGHTGVVIRAGARWLVHAGDAYFHPKSLEPNGKAPAGLRMFERITMMDRDAHAASVEALRRLRAEPDVDVFCAHEPGELAAAQARSAAMMRRSAGAAV